MFNQLVRAAMLTGLIACVAVAAHAKDRDPVEVAVSGVVRDGHGRPLEGAEVSLQADYKGSDVVQSARSDANGVYTITAQDRPGKFDLRIALEGHRTFKRSFASRTSRAFVANARMPAKKKNKGGKRGGDDDAGPADAD